MATYNGITGNDNYTNPARLLDVVKGREVEL